jgi:transposase
MLRALVQPLHALWLMTQSLRVPQNPNHSYDRELISKIYKELKKLDYKKQTNKQTKKTKQKINYFKENS